MRACPPSGASRPMIMRIVVDLPEPFGPRKPVTTPGRTVKLRSSTAVFGPYRLVRPIASITQAIVRSARRRDIGGNPERATDFWIRLRGRQDGGDDDAEWGSTWSVGSGR